MNLDSSLSSGPYGKMDLSLIDKVELGRAYSDVTGMWTFIKSLFEIWTFYELVDDGTFFLQHRGFLDFYIAAMLLRFLDES